jgi:ribonuclease R
MPKRFTRRILDYVADRRYTPSTVDELVRELSITPEDEPLFRRAVDELIQESQVVLGGEDRVGLPPPGRFMVGVFRGHERGFGFVVPDSPTEHGDLFIPPGNTGDALTGDHVKARVIHEPRRGGAAAGKSPYVGRVVEVVKRSERQYVGTLAKRGNTFVVDCDGKFMHTPVIIGDPHAKNAKLGDKVVVEIVDYGDREENRWPKGVITEVLGESGEPDVETLGVMRAYGLAEKFPPEVMQAAREASQRFSERDIPADREDLTQTFICTIDPPDAKDFDDAISIRRIEGERDGAAWELGVHIADVAYFVTPEDPLDAEAQKRGNSTYLPRKVIPMLPEVLSNGVCSLQEGVNRFTKSAFIRYDAQGNVVGERLTRAVIRSAKRMTYLEAQALIDGDLREAIKHARTEPKYPRELVDTVKMMDALAKVIRQRRLKDGMIVLGLPAVELVFDESGRVIDAHPEDDAFTHTIIEMFMVEANEAAARLFDALDVPMIRRIHPDPDAHDVGALQNFARVAGFNIPARPSRKELQTLLDAVRGKPAQQAVHLAVLKTLSKAEYSPMKIGHFALASEHYAHFTSPIRRYPDLIVHRGIDAYLEARRGAEKGGGRVKAPRLGKLVRDDPRVPNEERLHQLGRHCSTTEVNSESAERALRNFLVLELLSNHLGDDFAGTITGVTSNGAFVQLDKYLVDGFVPIDAMPGSKSERWAFNRTTGALVAQRSGQAITIGDRFTVRIASVDLARRQMELVILSKHGGGGDTGSAEASSKPHNPGKPDKPRKQPRGAARSHESAKAFKKVKGRGSKRGRRGGQRGH